MAAVKETRMWGERLLPHPPDRVEAQMASVLGKLARGIVDEPAELAEYLHIRPRFCAKLPKALVRGVGEGGVEPPRGFPHRNLNPARLPIPPLARAATIMLAAAFVVPGASAHGRCLARRPLTRRYAATASIVAKDVRPGAGRTAWRPPVVASSCSIRPTCPT
jgi:hypothetical protein